MTKLTKRWMSLALCAALIAGYIPVNRANAATPIASGAVADIVTDSGTAHTWESMMGTDADGNRYAGRVWVDKSVYQDGDTVVLNSKQDESSTFRVSLEENEVFQVVFSALGSTMTTTSTVSTTGPMDVVLVLDDSTSMDDIVSGNVTRLQKLIEASNNLLADLLKLSDVRIGIVAYNYDSIEVLPFSAYENGITLKVRNNKYAFDENNRTDKGGTIQAFDKDGNLLHNNTSGYSRGTNVQAGVNMGLGMLQNAKNTAGRTPVAIVLTDGSANTAVQNTFYNVGNQTPRSIFTGTPAGVVLATMLTAAYKKAKVEDTYGKAPVIYGVGVDIGNDAGANAVINPGSSTNGFHDKNSSSSIKAAYSLYQDWLIKEKVERTESYMGSYTFTFDHKYSDVTLADITSNINYVDIYYPVSGAELEETFGQIYEELSSGVFNPISSSTTNAGGTGVDDTPLIYVDFIGQYMEIKEIQAVTLFGASYGVVKDSSGNYTVTGATGKNPTTGENWNTAEDIKIQVIPQADGTQKLEIRINQEILPIIMEKVVSETVGNVSTATITEFLQDPLRVYYTVGLDSDILLPNGDVDIAKIQNYGYIDDAAGTVSFYSNRFGAMNRPDASGAVAVGDAHVGFQPSPKNRYYYHQTNQGIFTKITDKSGNPVTIPENNEYGIVWDDSQYVLSWMTYEKYLTLKDTDKVYTYVTYYHPTPSGLDAANAAEEVTYLVYTEWKYLKESVAFYDADSRTYLNDGKAIPQAQVAGTVAAYQQSNPKAQLYAVLGVGSRRTSRLHNMMVAKEENTTQTAIERYTPQYMEEKSVHNDNDVVVWLGNNGKLTVKIDTGIALTKAVTEAIGSDSDTYELTVAIPQGVAAEPQVVDAAGKALDSTYSGNLLTVFVKAGQTAYISGIPGGTVCTIGENIRGDYYIASKTDTVTVPLVSEAIGGADQYVAAVVTNAPNKYGNLYITKEITSDHTVPEGVLDTAFEITVNVGTELAGKSLSVLDSTSADLYEAIPDAAGNLVFNIKARQTLELLELPEGTVVTVTESQLGSHFAVSYRTRNHSGEDADSDNRLVIPSNGSATAVVLNHYTPAATAVDLDLVIEKDFADASVASRLEGGAFTFTAQKYHSDTNRWETLSQATIRYAAGEYGEKSAIIENVLSGETYTEVGTYSYRLYEEKGSVTNVSYDRVIYTFDVVVTDQGGQLAATVIGNGNTQLQNQTGDDALDYITRFRNTYETAPISMDIQKEVKNQSGDPTVSAAGFAFKSVAVDQDGNPLNPNEPETEFNTIYSDAAGEARISGVYTREQIGTHYYIVYEVDSGKPGWTYSQAQYFVTVVVAEDNGKLVASMTIEAYNEAAAKEAAPSVTDQNRGQLSFTNTYNPQDVSADLDGMVKKSLTGMELEADQFTFYVYKDGQRTNPLLTGKNELNGDVTFVDFDKKLEFDKVGKYQYDIVERIPTGAVYNEDTGKYVLDGMSYDGTAYDLVVEVTNDPATGKLVASSYFEDATSNVVTFYNSYKVAPTQYALGGTKVLKGRAPRNGEFRFGLYEGEELIQTVRNKADGSFLFDAITYTEAKAYTYTIRELAGNAPGVTYDGVQKPVTVTVTVTDVGGELVATANKNNEAIQFENTYTAAAATVRFNGTKEFKGGTLTDGQFTFLLYATDQSFDITQAAAQQVASAQNENGTFGFSRSFATPGVYYFVVLEDGTDPAENVVYDRTRYHFTVTVTDRGDGQLRAVVTDMDTGVASGSAASVSASVAFTNATFEEAVEKKVYATGNVTTEIDGKKVNPGDILTYYISYTNYTGENVVVDILDTIPQHTTYVEGSASHDGTYAGTHVNWVLNVAKDESVIVSFQVQVDEAEAIVTNTAYALDGVNTYTTNEVVNHTVDRILDKEVFSAEDETVSIDGQKVYCGDELTYAISFTNVSGETADVTVTDRIPANTTYVEGSASHGGTYAEGVITWTLQEIPAWSTETVTFRVTVNENLGAAIIENQATASDGVNQYETNWVRNYTVEDQVEKKLFGENNNILNLDGQKVYEGDTLIYTISYTNTARETATVTITDTIPQYTTYVDGSADLNGVYAEGVLTWVLEVEAGETVTVSFKVTVNEEAKGQTMTNTARVLEGGNSYETNQVTNPIDKPKNPVTPETGDPTNNTVWFVLMALSGGAILSLVILGRKKEKEEA